MGGQHIETQLNWVTISATGGGNDFGDISGSDHRRWGVLGF